MLECRNESKGCQQTEQNNKEGSVIGYKLVALEEVVEDRMLTKLLIIMKNASPFPP